ncbi:hypothetical protein ACIGXA_03350 [Streptomyces fildesensis]|uniref:Uncharacterized protein n=1 Tax=Streptomyces fildesensis TaxID=375757 RepID=A0ABW8BZF7_9ACTN
MSDASITQLVNLLTVLLALAAGTRLGYIVASRGTARDIEMLEKHFESSQQIALQQHQMQLEADNQRRTRQELKESYEALGLWLHELERTFEELYWGSATSRVDAKDKVRRVLDYRPWEVLILPAHMAFSEFYWTSDVRTLLRKLDGDYAKFLAQVRITMIESEDIMPDDRKFNPGAWAARGELLSSVNSIRDQARRDLGVR